MFLNFSFSTPIGQKSDPKKSGEVKDQAINEMTDLAHACPAVSDGKRQPICHWILSFPTGEWPAETDIFEMGREFLEDLGYTEKYQIIMSIHNNREHLHLHIVTNRVDKVEPEKLLQEGHGWEKKETQRACARLEKKYRLQPLEGNKFRATDNLELVERPHAYLGIPVRRQRYAVKENRTKDKTIKIRGSAARLEHRTGLKCSRRSLQEIFAEIEPKLQPCTRFGDLWRMLAEQGVEVKVVQHGP